MMHHLFLVLTFSLSTLLQGCGIFAALKPQPPAEPEAEQIDAVGRAVRSTVAILDGQDIYCSGVVTEGVIITAYHCVEGKTNISVRYGGKTYAAQVIGTFLEYDLAALDAVGARLKDEVPLSDWPLTYGAFVLYLGHPLGVDELLMFQGRVASPVSGRGDYLFSVDGQFIPGISGGPVLDERGRLMGIISGTMVLPQPLSPVPQFLPVGQAVKLEHVRELIDAI